LNRTQKRDDISNAVARTDIALCDVKEEFTLRPLLEKDECFGVTKRCCLATRLPAIGIPSVEIQYLLIYYPCLFNLTLHRTIRTNLPYRGKS